MHPCMYVLSQLALHPLLRSIFQIDASVNVCYPSYPARELLAHHFGSHSEAFCAASVHVCFPSSKNFTLSLWMYGYGIYDYHQTSTSVPQCYAVCSGQYTTGGPFRFTKTSQFEFTRCLLSFSQPFSSTGLRFDCLTSFSFALRVHLDPSALAESSSFAQRLPQLLPLLR